MAKSTLTDKVIKALGATDLRGKLAVNENHQWKRRVGTDIQGVVFHQTLGNTTLENVAKYHTGPQSHINPGGVHSISYTVGIRKSGEICIMNDIEDVTWSQGMKGNTIDENKCFIGVVCEGLFSWDPKITEHEKQKVGEPTREQMVAVIKVWNILANIFELDIQDIYGHFDWGKPACPGTAIQGIIISIRTEYNFESVNNRREISRFLKTFGFADLKIFQQTVGLAPDGMWGPKSATAAYRYVQKSKKA